MLAQVLQYIGSPLLVAIIFAFKIYLDSRKKEGSQSATKDQVENLKSEIFLKLNHIESEMITKFKSSKEMMSSIEAQNKLIVTKIDTVQRKLYEIESMAKWLKEAHDVKDTDGGYIWYVRQSIGESVKGLAEVINTLNIAMRDIDNNSTHQTEALKMIIDRINLNLK